MRCGTTGNHFVHIAIGMTSGSPHRARLPMGVPGGCPPEHRRKPPHARCEPIDSASMDEALSDNQALWDAWTRIHVPSAFYDVASFRDGARPIRLSEYELEEVGPVEGR